MHRIKNSFSRYGREAIHLLQYSGCHIFRISAIKIFPVAEYIRPTSPIYSVISCLFKLVLEDQNSFHTSEEERVTIENTEIINNSHFLLGGGGAGLRPLYRFTPRHMPIVVHAASFHWLLEIANKLFAIIVRYQHFRLSS